MQNSEIHLVLVWEKGLNKIDQILYDLNSCFDIIDVYKISWNKKYFSNNLSRFYGQNLKNGSFKEIHCGKGPFTAIIIRQKNPKYSFRETSNGRKKVNTELFEKKKIYRNWTGGGHKVHTSNDIKEASQNIFYLTNKKYQEIEFSKLWNGKVKYLKNDILGFDGWKDFKELFEFINYTSEYLILRNYSWFLDLNSDIDDIDFLSSDLNFKYHINGIKKNFSKNRAAYYVKVEEKLYNVDIRIVGDNYYDSKWSKKMVDKRVKHSNNFFIPDKFNEFYSLLYHSLIHKNKFYSRYNDSLKNLAEINNLKIEPDFFTDQVKLLNFLQKFMKKNGYFYTKPKDFTVQYSYGKKGVKRYLWELIGKVKNV